MLFVAILKPDAATSTYVIVSEFLRSEFEENLISWADGSSSGVSQSSWGRRPNLELFFPDNIDDEPIGIDQDAITAVQAVINRTRDDLWVPLEETAKKKDK